MLYRAVETSWTQERVLSSPLYGIVSLPESQPLEGRDHAPGCGRILPASSMPAAQVVSDTHLLNERMIILGKRRSLTLRLLLLPNNGGGWEVVITSWPSSGCVCGMGGDACPWCSGPDVEVGTLTATDCFRQPRVPPTDILPE